MNLDFTKKQHIHFIGIGGINMSSLAQVLLTRGFTVSGSDFKDSELVHSLRDMGAEIAIGHSADNITEDISLVVYTAAIKPDNPELVRAAELGIPTATRAEFLGQLMKNYDLAICVSGTHGKTTTTSLISQILLDNDADPTIMVGGMLPAIGGNTRIGHSGNFITEACEYTNSFLSFFPTLEVVLNVKADHLDFFKDLDDIRNSFRIYTHLLPDDGTLIINGEIDNLPYFTDDLKCRIITFGMDGDYAFTAHNVSYDDLACGEYDLYKDNEFVCHVKLGIPGEYNVSNSLAAFAAADAIGINPADAVRSIDKFSGVDRRFQYKGNIGGVTIIDDYAHHPDEIAATLGAALKCPHKKLWVIFQPHTYSRTKALFDEFAASLSAADAVVLTDIYAAREKDTLGISSKDLQEKIASLGCESYYFPTFDEVENFILDHCSTGDMVITMGAGDVYQIADHLTGK
ncbi:MAG: UDP-N-acetylmuramate--L-alanine ligase [Lachnospiraceae bacterium]|nr:UDP-N-acetylmuramate--L-alanine ligase [Lachnospiraceae bacterium]